MAKAKLNPIIKKLNGNIGVLIICRRHGVTYLRHKSTPRNPRTAPQVANRERFTMAVKAWQVLTATEKAIYNQRARRKKFYGYNLFISEYMNGSTENFLHTAIGPDPVMEPALSEYSIRRYPESNNRLLRNTQKLKSQIYSDLLKT